MAKREKQRHSLQKGVLKKRSKGLIQSQSQSQSKPQSKSSYRSADKTIKAQSKPKKTDTRVVWHVWSDGIRTQLPYRSCPGTMILTVGDGDLSFCHSFLERFPGEQLLCTIYDSDKVASEKYAATFPQNRDALIASGATVLTLLDATKLSLECLQGRLGKKIIPHISAIVFNFPHTGSGISDREHNIRDQQKLILGFFKAAARLLSEQANLSSQKKDDKFTTHHAILARSLRSEEERYRMLNEDDSLNFKSRPRPEIHLTCWLGDPYDDWNVKGLAASISEYPLRLLETFIFDPKRHPGYQHCCCVGYSTDKANFATRLARTFVFNLANKK